MTKKIRVLIVDDSAFMRKMLIEIIVSDPECEVIYAAKNGLEALKAIEELKPDVVTMDIELPEIDGITCVAYIMREFPTPVVIITGYSQYMGDETIKALEYGAVDFVKKPNGAISRNMEDIKKELLSKIRLASMIDVRKLLPVAVHKVKGQAKRVLPAATNKVVVLASSSGGPRALSYIIPNLPEDIPAGILVVQHMPIEFIQAFANRLDSESAIKVKLAEDEEPVQQGKVLIAPANYYTIIEPKGKKTAVIKLIPVQEGNYILSMADRLMISVAPIYGKNAVAGVLTGMGEDGTEGLRAIKEYGGYTLAEDESTAMVFGMPKSAIKANVVDRVVPLDRMVEEIVRAIRC